jgi:NADP-dependent 3-hydroxy acid dehydrogenase YdfG
LNLLAFIYSLPEIDIMTFPYNHVLLVGATAGIGKAMADRLIQAGIKVTAVGRRQDRLDDFVKTHGSSKAKGAIFDVADWEKAPQFTNDLVDQKVPAS